MNMKMSTLVIAAIAAGSAHGATLVDSSFNDSPSLAINTTGAADWGYFIATSGKNFTDSLALNTPVNFDSLTYDHDSNAGTAEISATVSKALPSIGAVTYTAKGDGANGKTNGSDTFTFDGTSVGSITGNIATTEEIFSLKFNDLGVGTHTMTFYIGHDSGTRKLDVDYFVYENDDSQSNPAALSATGIISNQMDTGGDKRISYSLTFTTTTANTDLVFNLGSAGSGSGAFKLSGYTVYTAPIPEPGSLALLGLGGLCLLRRRR